MGEGNTFPFFLLILNNKQMTKAQEFMTAVEDNNLFNHFSVIALRKENKTLQENNLNLKCENFELEQRLKACNDFNNLNNK